MVSILQAPSIYKCLISLYAWSYFSFQGPSAEKKTGAGISSSFSCLGLAVGNHPER